jgi:hypothetical protein
MQAAPSSCSSTGPILVNFEVLVLVKCWSNAGQALVDSGRPLELLLQEGSPRVADGPIPQHHVALRVLHHLPVASGVNQARIIMITSLSPSRFGGQTHGPEVDFEGGAAESTRGTVESGLDQVSIRCKSGVNQV